MLFSVSTENANHIRQNRSWDCVDLGIASPPDACEPDDRSAASVDVAREGACSGDATNRVTRTIASKVAVRLRKRHNNQACEIKTHGRVWVCLGGAKLTNFIDQALLKRHTSNTATREGNGVGTERDWVRRTANGVYLIAVLRLRESRHEREVVFF